MELLREIQLSVMLFLAGVCAALSILVFVSDSIPPKRRIALLVLELSSMVLLFADRYAYIYRGDTSQLGYFMVRICNFIVFFMSLFTLMAFNMYLKNIFTDEGEYKEIPALLQVTNILLVLGTVMLIVSQFTGLYYTFDEANQYRRSMGIVINYAITTLAELCQIIVIVKFRKRISKKMFPSILLFALVPIIATVVQVFIYGLSLTNISIVGMALLLYVFSLADMNEKVKNATDKEIAILKDEQENMQLMFEQTATALANAIDAKDKYTHGHSRRVAEYSKILAENAGKSAAECQEIYYAALLHDVGKIGVADHIINKEGKLTDEEFAEIKTHPSIGDQILSSINISPHLSIGARHHHERYDGKGYPDKLKGNDIPELARIIAVADAYDAMTSKRSYRDPLPQQLVREEIVKGMDTQFDPEFAKIMLHMIDLDLEYEMKEHAEVKGLSGRYELVCKELRTEFTEGIQIVPDERRIHLRCRSDAKELSPESIPTMLIFDSLDARVHCNDSNAFKLQYFEYAEIRLDGETKCLGARKMLKKVLNDERPSDELIVEDYKKGFEYDIIAVRFKDHARITVITKYYSFETVIALTDCSRYSYIAFTGQDCTIDCFDSAPTGNKADKDTIERIAPLISYIDGPEGDIPSIEIDGWRTDATDGRELPEKLFMTFHYVSLPTARLIWHCPFIVLFSSEDGKVEGPDYRELALIRFDGECWDSEEKIYNNMLVSKNIDFINWDHWRERNKLGENCSVMIERKANTIITQVEVGGLSLKNITTIEDESIGKVYLALTGDQVAISDIRIN